MTVSDPSHSNIERLKKRSDFIAASSSPFVLKRPTFVLQANANHLNTIRLGFTVTKRQGNSVKRNRIKRRLREATRQTMPEVAQQNYDYVFIGRQSAALIEFASLKQEITEAVKRLHHKIDQNDKNSC